MVEKVYLLFICGKQSKRSTFWGVFRTVEAAKIKADTMFQLHRLNWEQKFAGTECTAELPDRTILIQAAEVEG